MKPKQSKYQVRSCLYALPLAPPALAATVAKDRADTDFVQHRVAATRRAILTGLQAATKINNTGRQRCARLRVSSYYLRTAGGVFSGRVDGYKMRLCLRTIVSATGKEGMRARSSKESTTHTE